MIPPQYVCRDTIARTLEVYQILSAIPHTATSILDVGCGAGETLSTLTQARPSATLYGVEPNLEMCAAAQTRVPQAHIWPITAQVTQGTYAYIYTQRMLIQLPTWEEQTQMIAHLGQLLEPDGTLILVEPNASGVRWLNEFRQGLSLPKIIPPSHAYYLPTPDVWPNRIGALRLKEAYSFGRVYTFLSRIVNAIVAQRQGVEPNYESEINQLALSLGDTFIQCPSQYHCSIWVKD